MNDGRSKNGGARPNSGRKKKTLSEDLKRLMDESCPDDARDKIVRVMTGRAQSGDVQAATFIFNRLFGTPKSGDDIEIQERVEAEIERTFIAIREVLAPHDAEKLFDRLFANH